MTHELLFNVLVTLIIMFLRSYAIQDIVLKRELSLKKELSKLSRSWIVRVQSLKAILLKLSVHRDAGRPTTHLFLRGL